MPNFYLGFDLNGQGGLGTTNSGGGGIFQFDDAANIGTNTTSGSTSTRADYSNGMTYNSDTDQWILAVRGQAFYTYNSLADVQANNVASAVPMTSSLNYNNGFTYNADTGTYFAAYSASGRGAIVEFATLQNMANNTSPLRTVAMNGPNWNNGIEYDSVNNIWYGAFNGGTTSPGGVIGFSSLADLATASNPVSYTAYSGNAVDYEMGLAIVPCFTAGTLIQTQSGPVVIENLSVGDLVLTSDNGFQPVRWIGSRTISAEQLKSAPKLRPIRICAGALGQGLPESDLIVSPQHRLLVRSKIAQQMFGTDEVLAAAKSLLEIDGVEIAEDVAEIEYFHILFDQHEVIFANGAASESLYTGPEALKAVGVAAREEIFAIYPELRDQNPSQLPAGARPLLSGRQSRKLVHRHVKNDRVLIS